MKKIKGIMNNNSKFKLINGNSKKSKHDDTNINKIIIHPEKKSTYIEKIRDLVLYEKNRGANIE